MSNGFRTNLVLLYFDRLSTMDRGDSFVNHRRLRLNRLLLLLIMDRNPTRTGDLDGLGLLLAKHALLLLLLWGLPLAKLHWSLMNDFPATLQHSRVTGRNRMMSRRCFAAVDDDLLRTGLTLMIRLRWLALLFVDNLWRMRWLRLHLYRLTFVVGYQNLMGHPWRHGNIPHLVKVRRNVDQQISTSRRMMHC